MKKRAFVNPEGYFIYGGPFVAELTKDAEKKDFPGGITQTGNTVTFPRGARVWQSMGGIQFRWRGFYCTWKYDQMLAIRRLNGNPIWLNKHYDESGELKKRELSGSFVLELVEEVVECDLPEEMVRKGNQITFPEGTEIRDYYTMHLIRFIYQGFDHSWAYINILAIRRPNGYPVWTNRDYAK